MLRGILPANLIISPLLYSRNQVFRNQGKHIETCQCLCTLARARCNQFDTVESTGGPLHLSFPNFALTCSSFAKNAFKALGFLEVRSLIRGSLLSSQYNPFTINLTDATRDSSQTSFLHESLSAGKTNLNIYTHTMAT